MLLISLGVAAFAALFNLFSNDAVALSRISEVGPGDWIGDPRARQWDAITALGLGGAVMAGGAVLASVRAHSVALIVVAAAWAAIQAGLWRLVAHASSNTAGDLVLWQLAGVALLILAAGTAPRTTVRPARRDR